jgi:flagellar protein FliS
MRAARAYQSVSQHTSVIGASTLDLVLLLYEKLLDRLRQARESARSGDVAGRGRATGLAIEIIEKGMIGALDMAQGGGIAVRLKDQYQFWMVQLLRFNMEGDINLLDAIEEQIRTVRSGWEEIKTANLKPAHI